LLKLLLIWPPTVILKLSEPPDPAEDEHCTFESADDTTQDDPLNKRVTEAVAGEYESAIVVPKGPRSRPSTTNCAPPIVAMVFVAGSVDELAADK
jgi:hypothetical protein